MRLPASGSVSSRLAIAWLMLAYAAPESARAGQIPLAQEAPGWLGMAIGIIIGSVFLFLAFIFGQHLGSRKGGAESDADEESSHIATGDDAGEKLVRDLREVLTIRNDDFVRANETLTSSLKKLREFAERPPGSNSDSRGEIGARRGFNEADRRAEQMWEKMNYFFSDWNKAQDRWEATRQKVDRVGGVYDELQQYRARSASLESEKAQAQRTAEEHKAAAQNARQELAQLQVKAREEEEARRRLESEKDQLSGQLGREQSALARLREDLAARNDSQQADKNELKRLGDELETTRARASTLENELSDLTQKHASASEEIAQRIQFIKGLAPASLPPAFAEELVAKAHQEGAGAALLLGALYRCTVLAAASTPAPMEEVRDALFEAGRRAFAYYGEQPDGRAPVKLLADSLGAAFERKYFLRVPQAQDPVVAAWMDFAPGTSVITRPRSWAVLNAQEKILRKAFVE